MAGPGSYTYPFPRPGMTADMAVVTREARPRVLLVRRKHEPGAGSWALPGGFVEEMEPLADAARRELREETGVTVGEVEQVHTFGDPGRDPRGWTITVVYLARVDAGGVAAAAADDAEAVEWFPLDAPPPLAFDHAEVLAHVRARVAGRGD